MIDSIEIKSTEDLKEAFNKEGGVIIGDFGALTANAILALEHLYLTYFFETNCRLPELDELSRLHRFAWDLLYD